MPQPPHQQATPMGPVRSWRGFARVELMDAPTPLQRLPRLSEELGRNLWIKRDDLGATGLGGNKLRKLEFLLGDAVERGCDTLVTFGAVQSNHARQTAAAAAKLGFHCHLILTRAVDRQDELYATNGNRLLDDLFAAQVTVCDPEDLDEAITAVDGSLQATGATAAWIAPGGSEPTGVLGYVAAGHELARQCAEMDLRVDQVVVATSTGGTHAGLLHALSGGRSDPKVRGVAVYHGVEETAEAVSLLTAGVADILHEEPVATDLVELDGGELGGGYGIATDASREAQALFARSEGIVLDPVYTAKAAASLIRSCREAGTEQSGDSGALVFLHTGGAPGVFAYGTDSVLH